MSCYKHKKSYNDREKLKEKEMKDFLLNIDVVCYSLYYNIFIDNAFDRMDKYHLIIVLIL